MRYTESKEQSAELLRAALALMGRHDASFNPRTFAVCYEYAAGINAKLTRAFDQGVIKEPRLSDAAMARLYRDHVSEVDEQAMQRASGEIQRVMSTMAESAARTGDRAGAFTEQLSGLSHALRAGPATQLEPAISRALAGTAGMQDSAAALQRQVEASSQEIERLRDDLSRARTEALVDTLTRILNRKGFDQKLKAMLDEPARVGSMHWLVLLDIDRFKTVNDTYGHVMGDRLLQAVAEVLGGSVADAAQCVARYGGEEFAILIPHSDRQAALALAESCRERVKAMQVRDRRAQNVVFGVTISAGVTAVQPDDDAQSLIARADAALYAAKQAGRDRVHCV